MLFNMAVMFVSTDKKLLAGQTAAALFRFRSYKD